MQILLWTVITALPTIKNHIVRFDRTDYTSSTFTINQFPARIHTIYARDTPVRLTGKDAFIIDLICNNVEDTKCDLARKGLENAASRIAELLVITNPIKVQAKFQPFCSQKNCKQQNNLGGAVYGAAFIGTKPNSNRMVLYPQALLKQVHTDVQLVYSAADIIAQFNSDFPFYFRDAGMNMTNQLSDFEFVAVHELTHGLGFGSGLIDYGSAKRYLAPGVYKRSSDQDIISYFNPIDAFDSFVRGLNSFDKLGEKLVAFPKQNGTMEQFFTNFESSSQLSNGKIMYEEAVGGVGRLFFDSDDGSSMMLYSPQEFKQGTSISHVDTTNLLTKEFLMVPTLAPGVTLESIFAKTKSTNVYGPQTLAVLKSIGWPTNDHPNPIEISVMTNFEALGFATNSASEIHLGFTLLLIIYISIL